MIKSFSIKDVYGTGLNFDEKFNTDLNVFTGKNGIGKTTILKAIWYLLSGNFERLFSEIDFKSIRLEFTNSDYIDIKIKDNESLKKNPKIKFFGLYSLYDEKIELSFKIGKTTNKDNSIPLGEFINNSGISSYLQKNNSSIFFPTFRRIESTINTQETKVRRQGGLFYRNNLTDSLEEVSKYMSSRNHLFICTHSTDDITNLLNQKYAQILEEVKELDQNHSKNIIQIASSSARNKNADTVNRILELTQRNEEDKGKILKSFETLSNLIDDIYIDKSIEISNNLKIGQAEEAISSDKLSSGEKQMLSFLCYNFFNDNTIIFIDEPELSLHIDWQRILFTKIQEQEKSNQFIIATHSPFIYSKFRDKEMQLNNKK